MNKQKKMELVVEKNKFFKEQQKAAKLAAEAKAKEEALAEKWNGLPTYEEFINRLVKREIYSKYDKDEARGNIIN